MTDYTNGHNPLAEDEIFYGGFARTHDKTTVISHDRGPWGRGVEENLLDHSLNRFTPKNELFSSLKDFQRPLRQLIALSMVLGRRMNKMNEKLGDISAVLQVSKRDHDALSQDMMDGLERMTQHNDKNTSRIVAAQRDGTEAIVKALKDLSGIRASEASSSRLVYIHLQQEGMLLKSLPSAV
jgi:hypothetical protein